MKSRKFILLAVAGLRYSAAFGQFEESFTDGEFTSTPAWFGDRPSFTVSNNRLQLKSPEAQTIAQLWTNSMSALPARWEFSVELEFNTSSSNYAKVYLISDQDGLTGSLHGYFVKLGDTDEVSLYRQDGSTVTRVIDGLDNRINQPIIRARIQITRSDDGLWQLFTDAGLTGTFVKEGEAIDLKYTTSRVFGLVCTFTPTRADKFFFDDFVVLREKIPDRSPPAIVALQAIRESDIQITFTERLDSTSLLKENFMVPGMPIQKVSILDSGKSILLHVDHMTSGELYEVRTGPLTDLSGNSSEPVIASVRYYRPVSTYFKDVVITEIMADPTPRVGLPEKEYVELLNRRDAVLLLTGWTLTDGTSTVTLPEFYLAPHSYLVLGDNIPTLNNAGDSLWLRNEKGVVIDSLGYEPSWYRDEDKSAGGWSLELIDFDNICSVEDNWAASIDASGGTPGKPNSVLESRPDLTPPICEQVILHGDHEARIVFNETIDLPLIRFLFVNPYREIDTLYFVDSRRRTLLIHVTEKFNKGELYDLTLDGLLDCAGNKMERTAVNFAWPEFAQPGELLLSEVLFDPFPGGSDFIEVFNTTQKFLTTDNLRIGNQADGSLMNAKQVSPVLIEPLNYAVFTADPLSLMRLYPGAKRSRIHKTILPPLPDEEGTMALASAEGVIIDRGSYEAAWHSKFIQDKEGVSLERVSWAMPADVAQNWMSSASAGGFATPGYENSQHRAGTATQETINLEPEAFTPGAPDGRGFTRINYHFDTGGSVIQIKVMDPTGRLVRTVAESEVIGADGFFVWEGDRDDHTQVRTGYYVIWVEIYNDTGYSAVWRKRVIVW